LGRTGSTWVTRLLGNHPQIIAYRPFHYEPRVGSYCMEVLKGLSEPRSCLQMLAPGVMNGTWWLGSGVFPGRVTIPDKEMSHWLGHDAIQDLACYCQGRIESFYKKAAEVQKKPQVRYSVEKYLPGPYVPRMMWELHPDAREVILVRDFR